ncbi:hypothetical protein P5G65_00020 [Paenibacillus chondroitinus]|uniref:Uncharacterized protein n=1 Tax=Paenibacillus chondroitinus TaxID=59842 RepID=A0ABU6D3F6_9BACL|nr:MULTISPECIES: hypothetical protein [Paenibacillus]MCY9660937.1 hypothetical protein [Paenibacillus anseongense]MEB4792265.1 hypothetical protein [Paenibacillus chondroitinus]
MSLQQKAYAWIGSPVGVSLMDGTGTSGILCSVQGGAIYLIEYLYHTQFATKHYAFSQIRDIYPFPQCPQPQLLYQAKPMY